MVKSVLLLATSDRYVQVAAMSNRNAEFERIATVAVGQVVVFGRIEIVAEIGKLIGFQHWLV